MFSGNKFHDIKRDIEKLESNVRDIKYDIRYKLVDENQTLKREVSKLKAIVNELVDYVYSQKVPK